MKINIINTDCNEYEIDHDTAIDTGCDETLIQKVKICGISETQEILGAILRNEIKRNSNLGCVNIVEHEIKLNGEFEASKANYGVSLKIMDDVRENINDLLEKGIIKQADIKYISPAFFIKKANGKLRLVIEYINLNKVTIKAHNLRPKITDILSALKGKKFFSKLDLNQGFYQIKINEENIIKRGLRVLVNPDVFQRMLFGLT